jgi:hypothetical protein
MRGAAGFLWILKEGWRLTSQISRFFPDMVSEVLYPFNPANRSAR